MKTAVEELQRVLRDQVLEQEADAALVTSPQNRLYLTGFPSSAGWVLITPEKSYFLTDFRYFEAAGRQVKSCEVVLMSRLSENVRQIVQRHGIRRVLVENAGLSFADAKNYREMFGTMGAQTVEDSTLDRLLRGLRAVKTPRELQKIRDSQAITDAAFSHILTVLRPGLTEREVALEIEFFMRRSGAQGVAFDLIVVSGANGSLCHGVPSEKKIEKGDLVTMDIGALLDGYHSDMTRTVGIGHLSEEQERVYHTVLSAQLAAIEKAAPGVVCSEVDRAARDIIDREYPGTFGHSTGHGVGVEIHEWPNFAPNCQEVLRPGMVVTAEPGIYLPGKFGVRIEDMIAITEDGCENLTASDKTLLIL